MKTSSILGLTPRIGVVGWAVFVATTGGLLLLTADAAVRWQNWVAFAFISIAALLAVGNLPRALPTSRAWIVVALLLAAGTLPLWVETAEYVSFAPWYLRAITEVGAWLVLRGLPLQGWAAAALASGLVAVLGQPIAMARQLATLLGVQVLVVALARAARTIAAWQEERRSRVQQDESREVALATRRTELSAIASRAQPLLTRVAKGRATANLRRDAALLESELRDTLRGRRLAAEPLVSVAREARRRGLDVVLLDDLDGPFPDSTAAVEWAAELVGAAPDDVTVRVSNTGVTFVSGADVRVRDLG